MEVSDVRRRLQQEIERVRAAHADRRIRSDEAARAYERFLGDAATPVIRILVSALKAESLGFSLFTPAGRLRLASDRSGDDYIELFLDTDDDPPQVKLRVSRRRGRQTIESERVVGEGKALADLTENDVLNAVLPEAVEYLVR